MRLSDLIQKGPDGEDESSDKRKRSPKLAGSTKSMGDPSEEEKPFRLSDLAEMHVPRDEFDPHPPSSVRPDEERPFEPPELFQAPSPSSPPAPPPSIVREPSQPVDMGRSRRSVLMGPDPDQGLGEDLGESSMVDIPDNPYAPLRERAILFVSRMFQSICSGKSYPLNEGEEIIWDCIEDPAALEHLYSLAVSSKDTSNSLAIHLFNHSVYALKLGRGLKWGEDRLIRLGVASLIHDVGMCRVPQQIRHKEGRLSAEEMAEIRKHCRHGMEILLEFYGDPFRWLAEAVYHEHEREDGQGYPQGLAENQISEYAKVIGLADVYEALTHNRPHRRRMLPHKAVQEIVQTRKAQFHQKLLKIMLEELSLFSLNSLVRLNSNAIGRVAETIPGQPLRPVIRLLFDADGNEITEERHISLREFPLLYIVDEVEDSELPTSQ